MKLCSKPLYQNQHHHLDLQPINPSHPDSALGRPAPLEMCIVGVWQGEWKKGEQESTRTRQRNDRSPDVVRPTQGYQQQLYYGQSFCRYIADSDYVPRNESIVTNQDSRPRLFSGSSSIPSRVFIHLYAVTVLMTDLHRSHLTISFLAWFDNVHTIYIGAQRVGKVSLSTLKASNGPIPEFG